MATEPQKTAPQDLVEGARKAAILMVLLGEETSSRILQHFDEREILAIGREVAGLGEIDPEMASKVLREYRERILTNREKREGGPEAARRMLSKSLSPDRAAALEGVLGSSGARGAPDRPAGGMTFDPGALAGGDAGDSAAAWPESDAAEQVPFGALAGVKDQDLAGTLEIEHPQTAALVLMHLEPGRAAAVLSAMHEEAQAGITSRLARLSAFSSEVTREVSEALAVSFAAEKSEGVEERDGIGAAAEILKHMDRARSRTILTRLDSADAESAEKLRSRVYTFEMLLLLADRGIQEILKGVDSKQLGLALKGTTPEVAEKFFKNMSTRAAEMVKDEMEFLGVAKVKDVELAQKEILDKALRLEEEGVISFEVAG